MTGQRIEISPAGESIRAPEHGLYVGGEWRRTGRSFDSRNPSRPGQVVGSFAAATESDVADAYATAAEAAGDWRRRSPLERGRVLLRAAEVLASRADEVGAELSTEEGKTLAEGRGEVLRGADILRFYAGQASQAIGEVYPSAGAETFLYAIREPLGVVALITPWNFPIAIPVWKIAPALAYGNAIVWKPSELTPLCAVRVVEALIEAGLPDSVVNLVLGDPAEIGPAVTDDPRVSGISFTGSAAVGRSIQERVAKRGVKVQLELGGKNPAVILDDADLDLAVAQVVRGAMASTGQKCTATSRALVTPGVADRFIERLLAAVGEQRIGDPLDPETTLGPLVSRAQFDRVATYLDLAASENHALLAGGEAESDPDEAGYFVKPTVYGDVDPDSRIAHEEIFGPVLGVIPAGSIDEAIEVANGVDFGLSASIFTRDLGAAMRFAREVEAGVVHVNSETAGAEPQVPFGGMKASSSHSREMGPQAAEFYTDVKTVYVDQPSG